MLLTCIIGATAADFVPKAGAKYLIKCKGNNKYVFGTAILFYQQQTTRSFCRIGHNMTTEAVSLLKAMPLQATPFALLRTKRSMFMPLTPTMQIVMWGLKP